MYFSSEFIDDLREQIRISDVVGQKVKLQQKGKEYYGLCPFHNEQTPSFTVSNNKKFYHCFGCGAHGDIVKFIIETQGLDFVEAVKILANTYGVSLPEKQNAYEIGATKQILDLHNIMTASAKWFNKRLYSNQGLQALKYLTNRGVTEKEIEKFHLGFATDTQNSLYQYLLSQDVTSKQMLEVGLITESKDQIFDRFRNRIIFPIYDYKSHIIGFGGRLVEGGTYGPKYLNSPETILFKKGNNFYAENLVLTPGKKAKSVVIVEGYMDVIALDIVGITNVVATLGTSVTEGHLQKIWRYTPNPIICMDGDKAGALAMERCSKLALSLLKPGYSLQFVRLPADNDPDDVVKNLGKGYLEDLLLKPILLSEILWHNESNKIDVNTPEQKALLQKNLLDLAEQIQHQGIKQFYKKFFNDKLWHSFNSYGRKNKLSFSAQEVDSDLINVRNLSALQRCELSLIALIIEYPILLKNGKIFDNFIMTESKLNFAQEIYGVIEESFTAVHTLDDIRKFHQEFRRVISKKISPTQLNFLCGHNSYFVDKISIKNDNEILCLWEEAFNNYNLELLKVEYKKTMRSLDDHSMKLALTLQDEIMQLVHKIKTKAE